jgi:hypothetical protein
MGEMVVAAAALAVLVSMFVLARKASAATHRRARTVGLTIDRDGVRRRLADGREEGVEWMAVRSVEVVCTPVPTADGARAFVLLAESDERGCLVPLGVGHDTLLLAELARLDGFDLRRFTAARDRRAPARDVVWERLPAA